MSNFLKQLAILALEHGFTVTLDRDNKIKVTDDAGSIITDNLRELKNWMGY